MYLLMTALVVMSRKRLICLWIALILICGTKFLSVNIPFNDLSNNVYSSTDDVLLKLSTLRGANSVDPDDISGDFIYKLRHIFSFPLWIIFRFSFDKYIFPEIEKISHITPVFKSGVSSDVINYRPISISHHLSKRFESLVLDWVLCLLQIQSW